MPTTNVKTPNSMGSSFQYSEEKIVPPRGVELPKSTPINNAKSTKGGAISGAVRQVIEEEDVVKALAKLSSDELTTFINFFRKMSRAGKANTAPPPKSHKHSM